MRGGRTRRTSVTFALCRNGNHRLLLTMKKDSRSIKVNNSMQATRVNLTILYIGRGGAEVQSCPKSTNQ